MLQVNLSAKRQLLSFCTIRAKYFFQNKSFILNSNLEFPSMLCHWNHDLIWANILLFKCCPLPTVCNTHLSDKLSCLYTSGVRQHSPPNDCNYLTNKQQTIAQCLICMYSIVHNKLLIFSLLLCPNQHKHQAVVEPNLQLDRMGKCNKQQEITAFKDVVKSAKSIVLKLRTSQRKKNAIRNQNISQRIGTFIGMLNFAFLENSNNFNFWQFKNDK